MEQQPVGRDVGVKVVRRDLERVGGQRQEQQEEAVEIVRADRVVDQRWYMGEVVAAGQQKITANADIERLIPGGGGAQTVPEALREHKEQQGRNKQLVPARTRRRLRRGGFGSLDGEDRRSLKQRIPEHSFPDK